MSRPPLTESNPDLVRRVDEMLVEHPTWSNRRVAAETSASRGYVRLRRAALGIPANARSRSRPKVDEETLRATLAEHPDWTNLRLAAELGVGKTTIIRARRRLEMPSTRPRGRVAADHTDVDRILAKNPGRTNQSIAYETGRSPNVVASRRKALGLAPTGSTARGTGTAVAIASGGNRVQGERKTGRRIGPEIIRAFVAEHPDWSNKRIARELSVSPATVARYRKDLGLEPSRHDGAASFDYTNLDRNLRESPNDTDKKIAAVAGVSPHTVRKRRRNLGIPSGPNVVTTSPYAEAVAALIAKHPDWSNAKVAAEVGCSASAVRGCRLAAGLPSHPTPSRTAQVDAILRADPKRTDYDISEETGAARATIRRRRKALGIRRYKTGPRPLSAVEKKWKIVDAALASSPCGSDVEIAKSLGLGRGTVAARRKALGLPDVPSSRPHSRTRDTAKHAVMLAAFEKHPEWDSKMIADRIGLAPRTVRKYRAEFLASRPDGE